MKVTAEQVKSIGTPCEQWKQDILFEKFGNEEFSDKELLTIDGMKLIDCFFIESAYPGFITVDPYLVRLETIKIIAEELPHPLLDWCIYKYPNISEKEYKKLFNLFSGLKETFVGFFSDLCEILMWLFESSFDKDVMHSAIYHFVRISRKNNRLDLIEKCDQAIKNLY